MKFKDSTGMEIEISDTVLQELKERFKQDLQPLGIADRVSDEIPRLLEASNGRLLAEMKTVWAPVWYPEKLSVLAKAGFDVHTAIRKSKRFAPMKMYWVQRLYEIGSKKL